MNSKLTFDDLVNTSDVKFDDISTEAYRSYRFPGDTIVNIENPIALNVSRSGGHRVWDAQGISHYIPKGWIHLFWESKEKHFVK